MPGQCLWLTVSVWKIAFSLWEVLRCQCQQAGSVLLFSTVPIMELDGATIGITDKASSAPRLLQVLLRLKYGVRPEAFVSLDASYDAFLLIGNQALRQRLGAPGFRHTYDLGAEWHAWTVALCLSRWMARRDLDPGDRALLEIRCTSASKRG
jgi:predicted solute-binding protein